MNYFAFILLSQTDKLKEIWRNGTLVAEREDGSYHYELYQLGNYYAEKQFDVRGRISQISKTFRAACYLDPYLNNIDITSLYSG
jgi:hypothetical protein